jgi:hypothetical protein
MLAGSLKPEGSFDARECGEESLGLKKKQIRSAGSRDAHPPHGSACCRGGAYPRRECYGR